MARKNNRDNVGDGAQGDLSEIEHGVEALLRIRRISKQQVGSIQVDHALDRAQQAFGRLQLSAVLRVMVLLESDPGSLDPARVAYDQVEQEMLQAVGGLRESLNQLQRTLQEDERDAPILRQSSLPGHPATKGHAMKAPRKRGEKA